MRHISSVDFAKQLNRSHRFLKHPQHLSLQKTKEAIALIVIIIAIQPVQAQPAPTTATPLPWSALTQSGQRGAPRAVRPTVGREVHHSQDTRSTHKTQSRKEESRDRGRDWTHSRHQRRVITANAVSYTVGSEENDRLRSLLISTIISCAAGPLGFKITPLLDVFLQYFVKSSIMRVKKKIIIIGPATTTASR